MTAAATAVPPRIAAGSVADVVDAVRQARGRAEPLRISGRGTWLHAGSPVLAARVLDVSALHGITEYVPGDLTLTANAGTTLAEISDATAAYGQWFPLDPFGDPHGTLGATLATASAGPLSGRVGLPRDVTVGLSYVSGTGDVIHGGGKVVKNVAGFDLVRLSIGAWGTLGVITSATVRLRARPEADVTVSLALPPGRDALGTLLSTIRTAAVEPLAAELLTSTCARRIGLGDQSLMLVRLAGNATGVHHQRAVLAKLAPLEKTSGDAWLRLQQSDPEGGAVIRVSRRPSELARLWLSATAVPGMDAHASLTRGVVRMRLAHPRQLPDTLEAGDTRIFETAPVGWERPQTAAAPNDFLARRLRDAFDPARILNRGILGTEDA